MNARKYNELLNKLREELVKIETYDHLSEDAKEMGDNRLAANWADKLNIHAFKAEQIYKEIADL